jgi:CRP-like cAMP-binding protein
LSSRHQEALSVDDRPLPVREAFARETTPCTNCALRTPRYFCGTLFECDNHVPGAGPQGRSRPISRSHQIASRRRNIYRSSDSSDSVAIICEGWACAYISLPNGKRQILNFLLPGDITSPAAVFQDQSGYSVEAVTDLRYCMIDKAELRLALTCNQKIFDEFSRRWAEREEEIGQLATDLGHKTAEQRIARLFLGLMKRHSARNLVHSGCFEFPLRQRHIADATGLTVVHVNRVLGNMRRLGIVEIKSRALIVLNQQKLEFIAH